MDLNFTKETSTDPGVDAIDGVLQTALTAWGKVRSNSDATDAASLMKLLDDATAAEADAWREQMARSLYNSEAGILGSLYFHGCQNTGQK